MKNQQLIQGFVNLTLEGALVWDYPLFTLATGELIARFRDANNKQKWYVTITKVGLMVYNIQTEHSYELGAQKYGTNKNKLSDEDATALVALYTLARDSMDVRWAAENKIKDEIQTKEGMETLDSTLFDMQRFNKTTPIQPPIQPVQSQPNCKKTTPSLLKWFCSLFR